MKAATGNRGFTLIEIQIAVALLVLIMLLGYGALHFAGRSWQALDRAAEDIETQRLIARFLRRQLEQAIPIVLVKNGERQLVFHGGRDELRFVGRLPDHRGFGLHVIQLSYRRNDLLLNYRPLIDESSITTAFKADAGRILLTNIDKLVFSYYGGENKGELPRWQDEWRNKEQPPLLVRVNIETTDHSDWPVMTVTYYARMQGGRPELVIHGDPGSGLVTHARL